MILTKRPERVILPHLPSILKAAWKTRLSLHLRGEMVMIHVWTMTWTCQRAKEPANAIITTHYNTYIQSLFLPLQHPDEFPTTEVFQGCEGEEGTDRHNRDTQANVLDNEAGSLSELPDRQPPLGLTKSPGPSSPVPPSDSFLKRLGSLFHFFSKAEARAPQLEQDSAVLPGPGGVTCEVARTQHISETTGELPGGDVVGPQCQEMDKAPTEQDHSAYMAEETATEAPSGPMGQTPESLPCVAEDHGPTWSQAGDHVTLTGNTDEGQQQQAFDGPAVITHTTYRGQKEVRKTRRRQPVQIYSPISEGDESHPCRGVSSEGVGSPVSLTGDFQQHSEAAVDLPDVASEQSEVLASQEAHSEPSSQAAYVQLADAHGAACTHKAKDTLSRYQGCQESPSLCVSAPGIRNCEVNDCSLYTNKSLDVQLSEVDCNQGTGERAVKPRLPLDEDILQCESKAMVDIILKNALTALQKIETSEQENAIPHEADVEREPFTYAGARHGYQKEDYDFKYATQELEDKHVMPTHVDDQVISRAQGEGSRSTFSSGYESIAGSDTDIRCSPGQSFEGSPLALPTSGLHVESLSMAMPGIADSYEEKLTGDSESENTDCEKYDHESTDVIRNTTFKMEDGKTEGCVAFEPKPKEFGTLTFEGYSNSCLMSEPEVEDVDKEIRPKPCQNSEQSVQFPPVSNCTFQSGSINADNDKLVDFKLNTLIEHTEVGNMDPESFSLACKPGEKVQSQEVVRPKPLPIAQHSLASHDFKDKAVVEPTSFSNTESRPERSTVTPHQCVMSEDQCQNSELYVGATVSDAKESCAIFTAQDGLNAQDKNVDFAQLASSISLLVSGPQPVPCSGFPIVRGEEQEEEEEMDAIFVNDTGPMEKPTTRRGKTYPFSLSPIFEEEESLQVPPEEDLKSADQQTCSILSLLQSVSERLQSSGFTDGDPETWADSMDAFRCSRWGSLSDREDGDEENPPADQDLTLKDEAEMLGRVEETVSAVPHEAPKEKDCVDGTPSKHKRIASSPYYECLKSKPPSILPVGSITDGKLSKPLVRGEQLSLRRIMPRPSVMHIYDGVTFSGEKRIILGDVVDTWGMTFKTGVSIRVLTGCWLLYVEPGFKGSCVVLEEGEKLLTGGEGEVQEQSTNKVKSPDQVSIGSIRRVVKDDRIPEIHCHGEGESPVVFHSRTENLEAVQLFNLTVKSGCWLAYEQNGFSGNFAVLETGGKTTHGSGSLVTHARSLRPLTRGGPKVSRPLDPKMMLYELPHFQGQCRELGTNASRVEGLQRVSSLRVISGIWVGYSREHYRGQQCLLEEGEYTDCGQLGGSDRTFLSFRFLLADCIEPAISLRNAHSPETAHMDIVDLDVPDMEKSGPNLAPASICVKSGVWVGYSGKFFSGDQYILEKGQHSGPLDWGDCSGEVMSIRPVRLSCGNREPKHLIRAYSEPHFCGEHREYQSKATDCSSPHPMSFRVIHGSWVLFDEEGCSGNQFILTEGLFPDLTSCGNGVSAIKSLQPVPYCFSDPSISLFSLDSFEGLEMEAVMTMDDMEGFFTQSLRVHSGLWVVYEYSHFKGRQMLLKTGEYSMWGEHSGWDTIGSLQPLGQPKAYVQLRNRALGSVLTAEPTQDGNAPAKVSLKAPKSLDCQQWIFTDGLLKCKVGKACMSVIGGKAHVGARVALWPEHGRAHQRWSLNENGTVSSHLNHSLVLDIRGGNGIDRDHFIVNQFSADRSTQFWDIELV
ncbi:beta/gamma crystallin domain-containing protein 3 isoform X1 [Alosa pseudoharengus]|uniref:beta/gamma crystallin domain-containing protein 3 isoform X1 n=1 Tax=Alosa pseudoharengus TaxID=34774 RepID=UPI003F8B133C